MFEERLFIDTSVSIARVIEMRGTHVGPYGLLPCVRWETIEEFEQKSDIPDSFMCHQNNSGFSVENRWQQLGTEKVFRQKIMNDGWFN